MDKEPLITEGLRWGLGDRSREVQLLAPLVARTTREPSLEDILEDSVERPPEPPPWGLIGGCWELSTKSAKELFEF